MGVYIYAYTYTYIYIHISGFDELPVSLPGVSVRTTATGTIWFVHNLSETYAFVGLRYAVSDVAFRNKF